MTLQNLILLALLVALLVDWKQTITIAKNPDKWFEMNPILGRHPTVSAVNLYFSGVIALCAGLAWFVLPMMRAPDALVVTGLVTVIQAAVVVRNHRMGIK